MDRSISVYTGTACVGNPGEPGGWGAVIIGCDGTEHELNGGEKHTTPSKIEITGVLGALAFVEEHYSENGELNMIIYSNSKYIVKGASEWAEGWKRNNWCKADGGRVLYTPLWEQILDYKERYNIVFLYAPNTGSSETAYASRSRDLAKQAARDAAEEYSFPEPAGCDGQAQPSFSAIFEKAGRLWELLTAEQQLNLISEYISGGDVTELAARNNFISDAFKSADVKKAFAVTAALEAGRYAIRKLLGSVSD